MLLFSLGGVVYRVKGSEVLTIQSLIHDEGHFDLRYAYSKTKQRNSYDNSKLLFPKR